MIVKEPKREHRPSPETPPEGDHEPPRSEPIVRETDGRIPRRDDRHINTADGTACVLIPDEPWRLWPCPCRSGKRLRDCHFDQIKDLSEKISRKDAEKSLMTLKAAGESAVEMTEAEPPTKPAA